MPSHRFRVANVEFDLAARAATRDGDPVPLTPTEWKLLERLAQDAGRLVTNAELLTSVWGPSQAQNAPYLRVWISRLRRKLEPARNAPALIKTMQAIGYMLDARPLD